MHPVRRAGLAAAAMALGSMLPAGAASHAEPAWLSLRGGTFARVDGAPWPDDDEPEAALTASAASLDRDFSDDFTRPDDIVYEPVGVRVRIDAVLPGERVARVRGAGAAWTAYAPVDRLVPDIPVGTQLRVAGGFAGSADFYPTLHTPHARAGAVETGATLVTLGMGAVASDAGSGDLVRVEVRVLSGSIRGRTGWIPAGFTGIPASVVPPGAETAVKACLCRIVRFEGRTAATPRAPHHDR